MDGKIVANFETASDCCKPVKVRQLKFKISMLHWYLLMIALDMLLEFKIRLIFVRYIVFGQLAVFSCQEVTAR